MIFILIIVVFIILMFIYLFFFILSPEKKHLLFYRYFLLQLFLFKQYFHLSWFAHKNIDFYNLSTARCIFMKFNFVALMSTFKFKIYFIF